MVDVTMPAAKMIPKADKTSQQLMPHQIIPKNRNGQLRPINHRIKTQVANNFPKAIRADERGVLSRPGKVLCSRSWEIAAADESGLIMSRSASKVKMLVPKMAIPTL